MNRIAEHRQTRGLTQRELANLVGTDVGTISRYERGAEPSLSRAGEIAAALGVPIDELIHGREASTPETVRG